MQPFAFRIITIALLSLALAGPAVAARETTPAPSVAPGLPELRIRATDADIELPAEVPAGRYLVTLDNVSTRDAAANFVQLPAGAGAADLQALFQAVLASPDAGPGAFPDWYYRATFAGGPLALVGQQGQAVVDLTPGDWIVFDETDPSVPWRPLTVTAGASSPAAEPAADLTVTHQEYAFVGLPERLTPGRQVWKVVNAGTQPHELLLLRGPVGVSITLEQVMTLLILPPDATPPPGLPDPSESVYAGGLGMMSGGQTAWVVLDLVPGTYVMLCFIPDQQMGMPHATMGMAGIFAVDAAGTPAP
jgi:hypothetical protein